MRRNNIDDPRLREAAIQKPIEAIRQMYLDQNGFSEPMVDKMKALRQMYIELEQPTLVKSVRLVYEYAESKDWTFSLAAWEEENDISSLEYYLDLLTNPGNKYNREEIRELNDYLKATLKGEEVEFRPGADDEEEEEDTEENTEEA